MIDDSATFRTNPRALRLYSTPNRSAWTSENYVVVPFGMLIAAFPPAAVPPDCCARVGVHLPGEISAVTLGPRRV